MAKPWFTSEQPREELPGTARFPEGPTTQPPDEVRDLQKRVAEQEQKLETLAEAMGMEFIFQRERPGHWLAVKMASTKKGSP
jgi:hypothetical protein